AGIRVDAIDRVGDRYVLTAGVRRIEAENVVVASGTWGEPHVPDFAGELDPGIVQLHSSGYRNPAQLREGGVLVVGASHSGADIAFEVAAGHPTVLSGPIRGEIPFRIEGRPARVVMRVMWFAATRVLTVGTPIGRKMRPEVRSHGGPLIRIRSADLRSAGVEHVASRTVGSQDGLPVLDDGRVLDVANVIWSTGFRPDYSWIHLPILGADGYPDQVGGAVESQPGLYFVGLPFLHSFSSMLVGGAGRDAQRVVDHLDAHAPGRRQAAGASGRSST
ncbi:MAG TPA: NAD(P)-binding domain-containing protein, partial [Jiangellaceae bacterium]